MNPVTADQLKEGKIRDLHKLYGGLGSGRLVITGAPGSGKSGAAVLLILAALQHREQVDEADRSKVPVPVMFTLNDWEPGAQQVQDWLAVRLGQTYPQLAGRDGALKAALLLARGQISVILDGLDEISEKLRPVALQGLSQQATFRLVVLTRLDEMAAAAARVHLEGAAAVELQSIDADTAADYLTRVQLDPPPPGWSELTEHLRQDPGAPVAEALSTPLTLTLVRDTYREGDNVREILNLRTPAGRAASRDDIVDHLLDRVLPAAYTQRPGQPPLTYDLQTAQHALRHIAAQMNQDGTRDLRWWLIPSWMPRWPRACTSALAIGCGVGAAFDAVIGIAGGATLSIVAGIVVGVLTGVLTLFKGGPGRKVPQRIGPVRWRKIFWGKSLMVGLSSGLALGALAAQADGVWIGILAGLVVGTAGMFIVGLDEAIGRPGVDDTISLTPVTAWRNDWMYWLVTGVTTAAGFGVLFGVLAAGARRGLGTGVVTGITVWLGIGVVAAVARHVWWVSLTFVQLSARWHVPVRAMKFLEDARQRNVLRTIGPVYQFRHARLQDRLAEQASTTSQP